MRGMRKSTLWLASLFLACMAVIGWRCVPESFSVTEAVSEWGSELGFEGLRNFLKWRSPGIVLEEQKEEEERLLEAEQQAYAVLAENETWRKSGQESAAETGKKTDTSAVKGADSSDDKINDKNSEKTAKTVSFPEYVQAAAGNKLHYSWEQLTDFEFLTSHFYQIHGNTTIYPSQLNAKKYLKKDLSINRDTEGPQILIYHTHGSEYFADSDKENPDTLITGVGEVLAELLEEKYGYRVYHDTTVFPYNSSYSLGRRKVQELMEKYPGIQVVIDMHRDSAPNTHLVTKIDGKPVAQIMFFNGMSQTTSAQLTSRNNSNLADNLAFSLQLKLAAEQLYPGFTRKNYLKAYRYNMDLVGRYALIEVGAETNSLQEEKNAMEPLAKILHCVLQ
ncbi:MAG: stage II sporulation protein P [Lachnospiraceae bacterium]|nr:stage II sporulation protein P [Lachnospiraceae bacterium]